MYLEFFQLREYPFQVVNDARYFFQSTIHAEALANMIYTIQQRKGMVLITGEIGSGKTFVGNMLASRLGESAQVVMVAHPPDSPKQLLRALAEALDVRASAADDKLALVKGIQNRLLRAQRRGKPVALILDEVQSLSDKALEEVRFVWNWESHGQRLIQIVLIGQSELRDRLRDRKWESFLQRVVLAYHLGPLNVADTARYILHRRKTAALNGSPLRFTVRALEYIYRITGGVPRLINTLCDNTLLLAYSMGTAKISSGIVAQVAREMTAWSIKEPPPEPPADPAEDAEEGR